MTDAYTWDSTIESDGTEYITLEAGTYPFSVVGIKKEYYNGGPKTPASPQATLTLRVSDGINNATIRDQIILHPNFDWKIAGFFRSIGAKKHGQSFTMNWDDDFLLGKRGIVVISKDAGKKNPDVYFNNVVRYVDADDDGESDGEEAW